MHRAERIDEPMKNFLKNYSKPGFRPSIFGEGMRQLRLLGIIYAVVCAVLCLLEVFDNSFFNDADFQKAYTVPVSVLSYFDEFAVMMAVASVIFIVAASLYIMQFMRTAKARDFYCSTPHSVGTVWLNFAAAVYVWHLIGLLAGYVLFSLILMTQDIKLFGLCLQAFAGNFAFSLMVFGIVMLSVTLTGRIVNTIATTVGLALLPSMLWADFHAALMNYFHMFSFIRYPEGLTCPDPFGWLLAALGLYEEANTYANNAYLDGFQCFCSGQAILYCLVMGILYFAAAFLFASIRMGDTAGRPFVNKPAHIISFLALTAPIICFAAQLASNFFTVKIGYFGTYYINELILEYGLAIVVILALCWLSELLLTFDLRHAHRALKYLSVPVLAAALLVGCGYAAFSAEMTTTVDAEDVESFTLVRNASLDDSLAIFRLSDSYGRTVTETGRFKDADTIQYVTAKINDYVSLYQKDPEKAFLQNEEYYEAYGYDEYDEGELTENINYINIKLNLKNGKSITRTVPFDDAHVAKLAAAIENDKAYMKRFLSLPDGDKLNINVNAEGLTPSEATEIYKAFVDEYNAMSDEAKLAYLKANLYSDYNAYDYQYYDPVQTDPVTTAAVEEKAVTTAESVSYTDITLVSKSHEAGDYIIDYCYYHKGEGGLSGTHALDISIDGYADGHLYDYNYYFNETFVLTLETMPNTHALIVKTCNAKIPELLASFSENRDSLDVAYLTADYVTKEEDVTLHYDLVTKRTAKYYTDYAEDYVDGEYDEDWEYYDSETGEHKPRNIKTETIEVDTQAMIDKLLKDAAATGESVDFSKPYCELVAYAGKNGRDKIQQQYFIQTEFEVMK